MERDRGFLLALIAVFVVLGALLLRPYLQYVLAAILLAYVLWPLQRRIEARLGRRGAALSLLALSLVAVVVPLALLARTVAREAPAAIEAVQTGVEELPAVVTFAGVEIRLRTALLPDGLDGTDVAQEALALVGSLSDVAIGLTVFAFALYYLLVERAALREWIRRAAPLPDDIQDDLHARIDRLLWASVVGNVVVGVVQGAFAGLGFWAVGLPSPLFWSVVTTLLALLPLVGASVVWIPAAGFLFLTGDPIRAVALAVYGTVVVSVADDYVRPMVGGHEADLNPGLFVLGIFGGLAVFGVMGLFFGPIVLGTLKALVEVYGREYATGA